MEALRHTNGLVYRAQNTASPIAVGRSDSVIFARLITPQIWAQSGAGARHLAEQQQELAEAPAPHGARDLQLVHLEQQALLQDLVPATRLDLTGSDSFEP